ncbi:MAG: hypothetical protein ACI9S9_004637 [Planctomycetota bacterium]|jgi:hypothetical protein
MNTQSSTMVASTMMPTTMMPTTMMISIGRVIAVVCMLVITGCGGSRRIEVIDLDRVLTILDTVMKTPIGDGTTTVTPEAAKPAEGEIVEVARIDSADEREDLTAEFLTQFTSALNAAKMMSRPIGVVLESSGAMLGFTDNNGDRSKGGGDHNLFRIEVDTEKNRIIASDLQRPQYRRDHYYGRSYYGHGYYGGGGFFMGYMLGSMSGRSHRYYGGSIRRPNYGGMSMAPSGYQRAAVTTAKTKAKAASRARSRARSSARSRGGSSSFRSGK